MPLKELFAMIEPDIICAITQARFMDVRYSPRSLPTLPEPEKSSMNMSSVAMTKFPEMKNITKAKIKINLICTNARSSREIKHKKPKITVVALLPYFVRIFGSLRRESIVSIEAIA
jgi:hypothetical protein